MNIHNFRDNGGTRSGTDRRRFQYTACIPERRSGMERRKRFDRRSPTASRKDPERRVCIHHQGQYPLERRDLLREQSLYKHIR